MRKQELSKAIANNINVQPIVANAMVESFIKIVRQELMKGGKVTLRTFGTFKAKRRAAKLCRNITRNTTLMVPAHSVPFFIPAQEFKDKVKNVNAEQRSTFAS